MAARRPRARRDGDHSAGSVSTLLETSPMDLRVLAAALTTVTLALFDAAATYLWLAHGIALEANPLLSALMASVGEASALLLRTGVVVVLVVGLASLVGRSRLARPALYLAATAFAAVAVWHLQGMTLLLGV